MTPVSSPSPGTTEGSRKGHCCTRWAEGPDDLQRLFVDALEWRRQLAGAVGPRLYRLFRGGFWDKGSFYDRVTDIKAFGVEANADTIGKAAAGTVGAAIAAHAAVSALARARNPNPTVNRKNQEEN